MGKWVVIQLGSREQYNVTRALHVSGRLHSLVTDLWIHPNRLLQKIYPAARSRYREVLSDIKIVSFNWQMIMGIGIDRFTGSGFKQKYGMIADKMFSYFALSYLKKNVKALKAQGVTHIFCYNYYASAILSWAKDNGFICVLGQIDAGPAAGKLVKRLARKYDIDPRLFHDHYEDYIDQWKQEINSASVIVANSNWSKKMLIEEGTNENIIKVVPLAFERVGHHQKKIKTSEFNASKPLAVLFLGSLQIQKGVIESFEAAASLLSSPVVFSFAGTLKMPAELLSKMPQNCKWLGFQDRAQVERLLDQHHVLLFPTHSDGFGLVQLEAMAHGVPVIASTHCGKVVEHEINGLVIDQVTPSDICAAINRLLNEPGLLPSLTEQAIVDEKFSFDSLVKAFTEID